MEFLRNLAEQLKGVWLQSSKSARMGIAATGLVCVVAILGAQHGHRQNERRYE